MARHALCPLFAQTLLLATLLACTDPPTGGGRAPNGGGSATDAGVPDSGTSPDAGMADAGYVPPLCRDLGLPPQPFKTASATYEFGDIAGDFTVNTLYDGPWSLRENWTGCESFVFLNYIPTNGRFEEALFGSNPEILAGTPHNAHFFFMSSEGSARARENRVANAQGFVDSYIELNIASADERARQKARFHYVTDAPSDISGSVGAFVQDYMAYAQNPVNAVDLGNRGMAPPPLPFAFAIDRDQAWDSGGNLNEVVGGDPSFKMASFLPGFFDYKTAIRDAQAVETGVQTIMLLEDSVSDRVFERDAMLPSDMSGFDTAEFDVTVICKERNVFGCSEWDRIALIEYCLDDMCMDRREIIRWITPYWRRGSRRWVIDATALLGMLKDGGMQRFRIVMGPSWERATSRDVRVALRLRNSGHGVRAVGFEPMFSGGNFNADYNTRDPMMFTPPAGATKVELVVMVSGHGQADNTNCSEWCDHRHQFAVNSVNIEEIRHEGSIGSRDGCGPAASAGAPPGQWGNWAPERAYWCPGLPVDHKRFDITNDVMIGQENTLTYSANYRGGAPGGGNIDLSTYVVWFE